MSIATIKHQSVVVIRLLAILILAFDKLGQS